MSAISEKVRAAIYTKTNVGAVVGSGKLSGIYESRAPASAILPYGVFGRTASEPVIYSFGDGLLLEVDWWEFRVYAEAQSVAETLLIAWTSTLGNSLTLVGGGVVERIVRRGDLGPTDNQQSDRFVFGRGALIEVAASNG